MTNICVIENDPIISESLRQQLSTEGFEVDLYDKAHKAYERMQHKYCDIMLCNTHLPDMTGSDLYQKLLDENYSMPPFVFMAAHDGVNHDANMSGLGDSSYITKPIDAKALISKLNAITNDQQHTKKNANKYELGKSSPMLVIQQHLENLARYRETPLLISGESGVGKEVVARYLHQQQKSTGPFVAINCSAIPEGLIESELFGHDKGAFTGAARTHKGAFEQAHGGTLLLDEIGDMPLLMQAKLLRVLEECAIKRVGGEKNINISTRLIFATNKDLEQKVKEGLFREDLFFRINVIHTRIPSLFKRKDDILWLANYFIKKHQQLYPDTNISLHDSAKQALLSHKWPGNVRELKNTIEHACIMSTNSTIRDCDIVLNRNKPERSFSTSGTSLKEYMESREKDKIASTLVQCNGCINQTSKYLKISRKSLWEKMKKYNIEK